MRKTKPGRRMLRFCDLTGKCMEAKQLRGGSPAAIAKDFQRLKRVSPWSGTYQ